MKKVFALAGLLASFYLPVSAAAERGAETPPDTAEQNLGAWFQSTWIVQRKSALSSPYSGANSLIAEQERSYTFTNTAYLGARPWQGGEVYLNVESAQGHSFSGGLIGLGAFSNGELVRGNSTNPTIYRQRIFLRQTWNQGGGNEFQESEANQLAGSVDKNRFVLTLGNFSVLDIFDDNAYAKDPRTQFLNFSFMSHPAFDYAADARGYSWGFAGEWYVNDWVLRFGRMTGPREPNGLPGDYNIGKHYGDQVELEHAHSLAGQPGKVRLLAWRNRAVLARFDDALANFNANPGADPQAILRVRNTEQTKYGLGVNVEQAVNDSLGVFMRAMKADGHTETYAFVEADSSASFGAALKGTAWGRTQDTVGLGFARNMLSRDRRNYLAAGAISFFIGDGALNYKPEDAAEIYYNWNVAKHLWLTADYQHIRNPAYNADRGPVNVIGMRMHAEF